MPEDPTDATPTAFTPPAAMFEQEPSAFEDPYARRCFRVLRMVSVLHGKGFHGLRVFPYEYPLAYRIELFPATYADETGVRYRRDAHLGVNAPSQAETLVAGHSGANGADFFQWEDARDLNAHQLAVLFIKRYPTLARASYHFDFAYAGWYATLLAHCEYGFLPYLFAEYEEMKGAMRLRKVGGSHMDWFPLPPSPAGDSTLSPTPTPPWLEQQ